MVLLCVLNYSQETEEQSFLLLLPVSAEAANLCSVWSVSLSLSLPTFSPPLCLTSLSLSVCRKDKVYVQDRRLCGETRTKLCHWHGNGGRSYTLSCPSLCISFLSCGVCVCVCVCVWRVLSVTSVRRGCVTGGSASRPMPAPVPWQLPCAWSARETSGVTVRERER